MMSNQKWEYCVLTLSSGKFRYIFSDKSKIKEELGGIDSTALHLSELGKEGWELVSCVNMSNHIIWTLKREV